MKTLYVNLTDSKVSCRFRRSPNRWFWSDAYAGWTDHDLEKQGRLTQPLRWDQATDRYVPGEWDSAPREIAGELKAISPDQAVFYASGRASLETSYMYALMTRLYGTNNQPDSSNMCHESTSVALPESIGVPV